MLRKKNLRSFYLQKVSKVTYLSIFLNIKINYMTRHVLKHSIAHKRRAPQSKECAASTQYTMPKKTFNWPPGKSYLSVKVIALLTILFPCTQCPCNVKELCFSLMQHGANWLNRLLSTTPISKNKISSTEMKVDGTTATSGRKGVGAASCANLTLIQPLCSDWTKLTWSSMEASAFRRVTRW